MFEFSYGLFDLESLRERVTQVIAEKRAFAWDIETGYHGDSREKASLHPEENFIAGLSLTNSIRWGRYAPLAHEVGPNLDEKAAAEILYPLLVEATDDEGVPLGVCHGGKFELRVTRLWLERLLGVKLDYDTFRLRSDTMLESYAEAIQRLHGLKELTEFEAERDATGFWHKQLELWELFPDKLTLKQRREVRFSVLDPRDPRVQRYACEDSIYTLAHHRKRYPRLQEALKASPGKGPGFIWKLEMAVLPIVCEMEDEGIQYDWIAMAEWAARGEDFAGRFMDEVREDFGGLRGEPLSPAFNFGSSQQLARLLYEDCGMPISHWTKGGKKGIRKPSTDAKVALKGLSKQYPEVAKYLNWKRLTKLYRDFLKKWEDMYCYADDRRAHASLMQHGVPAGRFACGDPNYQQSPKKYHYELRDGSVFDFNFRDMIIAPDGYYILGFDLSQAELRAVAGMAGEQKLIEAFEAGVDVHKVTASLIFGIPFEDVTYDHRDVGKTMGFALVYGLTEDGLADRLGITREKAQDLFAAFHVAYPAIKAWTEATIRQARETYRVKTWWDREVPVWGYVDADNAGEIKVARAKRRDADRTAGNAPVQGSATGDYMKIVMVRANAALAKAGLKDRVRLAMNVHDALEYYVRKDVPPAEVIRVLQSAAVFPVPGWPPMAAEWHMGAKWGSVRELEVQLLPDGSVGQVSLKRKEGMPVEAEVELGEEDEDDVAVAPVLPALDQVGVVAPAAAWPESEVRLDSRAGPGRASDGAARTVIITAMHPFPEEVVPELVRYVRGLAGPNAVKLRLADGMVLDMAGTSGLDLRDQAAISVILGGATVAYDAASVDLAAIAAGVVDL